MIKKFEKSKSWLSKKLSSSNNQVDQLANILEEKSSGKNMASLKKKKNFKLSKIQFLISKSFGVKMDV